MSHLKHFSIPEIEGVQDPKVAQILIAMKYLIETVVGKNPRKPPLVNLGGGATLSGVINKINEIIETLQ